MAKKLILTVHGIGEQQPFETLRLVTNQFTRMQSNSELKTTVSLGYFHTNKAPKKDSLDFKDYRVIHHLPHLFTNVSESTSPLGFSECYWGDIPRNYVEPYLDSTDNWIKALVGRVKMFSKYDNFRIKAAKERNIQITNYLSASTIQSYSKTLDKLRRLIRHVTRLLPMLKIDFNLKKLINNYLGDVQFYAEYQSMRENILNRFSEHMDCVHKEAYKDDKNYEIHVIAHSLGSVVSFHGLLRAIAQNNETWLNHVKSFTTIGSPIDKFLFLFPNIMKEDEIKANQSSPRTHKIAWHNYSDVNDPVSAPLDDARDPAMVPWVKNHFNFDKNNDVNMKRYRIPGLAHVDYWKDNELFNLIAQQTCWPNFKTPKDKPTFKKNKWMDGSRYPFYLRWLSWLGGVSCLVYIYIPILLMIVAYIIGEKFHNNWSDTITSLKFLTIIGSAAVWVYLAYVHVCVMRLFWRFEKSKKFLSK